MILSANGSYTYTASNNASALAPDGFGQDIFAYTATYNDSDGPGGTASATLTFVVTSSSVTYVSGSSGSTITASNGQRPVLDGGAGDVTVIAPNGPAVLIGGPGDTLTGGHGRQTFVFLGDFGHNTITNFNTHTDVIQLAQSQFPDFTAVHNSMSGTDNTVITYDDTGNTITLIGVAPSSLDAHDFQFV